MLPVMTAVCKHCGFLGTTSSFSVGGRSDLLSSALSLPLPAAHTFCLPLPFRGFVTSRPPAVSAIIHLSGVDLLLQHPDAKQQTWNVL